MSTILWQRGTLYPTGSVVRPTTAASSGSTPLTLPNGDFELGRVGWTLGPGFQVVTDAPNSFNGSIHARLNGPSASSLIRTTTSFPVTPGQRVSASCMIRVNAADRVGGVVAIVWLAADGSDISSSEGNGINVLSSGYTRSSVSAVAPAGAAAFQIAGFAYALQAGSVRFDGFVLDYQAPATVGGLVFRAVQPAVGTSASTEPTWPTVAGQTVVDGTVTWEAFNASIVVWEAEPIMVTGAGEPAWPTVPGASVTDGSGITWVCTSRHVKDARCPRSKVVAIAATKVFAADGDVVRYSATGNPLDWSTPDDAGFLPTGLNQNGANRIDVLNLYRSNLVAFNASTFQMWQVDPDPEQMALLDTMEGIGSIAQKAAQPVANDLFFLTALGVRTVGIAGGSTNLQAGDVGMPIDPLVQEAVEGTAGNALACYYPAAGQYWLVASSIESPPEVPPAGDPDFSGGETPAPPSSGSGNIGGSIGSSGGLTVTGSPAPVQKGVAYTTTFTVAGGTPPYTWTSTGRPPGLTLTPGAPDTSSATLAGTNTGAGRFYTIVFCTDSTGKSGFFPWEFTVTAPLGAPIALANKSFESPTGWTVQTQQGSPGFSFQTSGGRTGPGFLRWQSGPLPNVPLSEYFGDIIYIGPTILASGNEVYLQAYVRCSAIGESGSFAYAEALPGLQIFEDAAATIPLGPPITLTSDARVFSTGDWRFVGARMVVNEGLYFRFGLCFRTGVQVTLDVDDVDWDVRARVP